MTTIIVQNFKLLNTLVISFALLTMSAGAATLDWSMMLTPQSTNTYSGQAVDFTITFTNDSSEDISFSDFGDGSGITVDLEGTVVGSGACGPGVDCFVQNLFVTSPDPIDIPAGSSGTTFDLGVLYLGNHNDGDQITVIAKGGPDSLPTGSFPDPAFAETSANVNISASPEPSSTIPCLLMSVGFLVVMLRRQVMRVW